MTTTEAVEEPQNILALHRALHKKWRSDKFKLQIWLTKEQMDKVTKLCKKAGFSRLAPFAREMLTGSAIIQRLYGTPDKTEVVEKPKKRAS